MRLSSWDIFLDLGDILLILLVAERIICMLYLLKFGLIEPFIGPKTFRLTIAA